MPKGKGYGKSRSKFIPKSNLHLRQKGPKGPKQKSVRKIKREIKSSKKKGR